MREKTPKPLGVFICYDRSMQIYHVISIVVPLVLMLGVPAVLQRYGHAHERRYRSLLYVACGLFFISWYLPSPLIEGRDTSFTTHFIGGGVFTGLLWIYLKQAMEWRGHWLLEASSLFALVSALGCINELFELVMVKSGLASILLEDTNWDILANTLGAGSVYLIYIGYAKTRL